LLITIADIEALNPCYSPTRYLPEDWKGTLTDILDLKECPAKDRIWVVTKLLDDRTNRLFAVACAREALSLIPNPDPRSIAACDVAERYANGQASDEELAAAGVAAWDVAGAAAWDVAWTAAWTVARDAAWDAARAARDAAWTAAWTVARDAAWDAAWDAPWDAAWDKQIEMLRRLILS